MNQIKLNGVNVDYIDRINLRLLFTIDYRLLPNLPNENIIYCIHNELNGKC
mgnify:CR=1 FL=1